MQRKILVKTNFHPIPTATLRPKHSRHGALLKRLQKVFDGDKEGVLDMIATMESLGVHARKVMWTNLSPPSPVDPTEYPPCAEVTCGPVWDYDWD